MALEIRAFDPGKTTGYFCAVVVDNGRDAYIGFRRDWEYTELSAIYSVIASPPANQGNNTIEVCFEDWRTFPGGPPYSKVIAKEIIGVIKIACIHAGIGWHEYMPATKSLIQDKHLKALDLWHSSKHIQDATKIALVHLHRFHRELFDTIMKEVLQ